MYFKTKFLIYTKFDTEKKKTNSSLSSFDNNNANADNNTNNSKTNKIFIQGICKRTLAAAFYFFFICTAKFSNLGNS